MLGSNKEIKEQLQVSHVELIFDSSQNQYIGVKVTTLNDLVAKSLLNSLKAILRILDRQNHETSQSKCIETPKINTLTIKDKYVILNGTVEHIVGLLQSEGKSNASYSADLARETEACIQKANKQNASNVPL